MLRFGSARIPNTKFPKFINRNYDISPDIRVMNLVRTEVFGYKYIQSRQSCTLGM